MVRKKTGIYNPSIEDASNEYGQLYAEISGSQVALMVKDRETGYVEALEVFVFESPVTDWEKGFATLKKASQLLSRKYPDTHCYFHFEEAIVLPEHKFNLTDVEEYISFVHGEREDCEYRFDALVTIPAIRVAYRLPNSLLEMAGNNFLLYKPHHIYSAILDDIFGRQDLDDHFLKVLFYEKHFILALVKKGVLQIIQSVPYQQEEDILYHLINLGNGFELDSLHANLEISGLYDPGTHLHQQVVKLFGRVSFDTIQPRGIFASVWANHPSHYFTPYNKLAL